MNSNDIKKALKKRYPLPEWSIFFEVANETAGASRYADAIAFNSYPSKGLEIVGMEIKVSRSDLLNELKNPEKADEIGKYCDTWYLVTPRGLINDKDDIPSFWGIIEVSDDLSTRIKKRATKKEAVPIQKSFMMAVLRRASEFEGQYLNEIVEKKSEQLIKTMECRHNRKIEQAIKEHGDFKDRAVAFVKKFEEKTGINVDSYRFSHHDEIIESFKFALRYGVFGTFGIMNKVQELKNLINKIGDL